MAWHAGIANAAEETEASALRQEFESPEPIIYLAERLPLIPNSSLKSSIGHIPDSMSFQDTLARQPRVR
jgi:hypothetical protein